MRSILYLVLLVICNAAAIAQQADVRVGSGPYYVGVPIEVQVSIAGFEREPEPEIEVDAPEGGTLELTSISPSVSSNIQIINGQMTRSENVSFVYGYRLIAERPGSLTLGPFRITQGKRTVTAQGGRLDVREVPTTSEQRFRLVVPEGPLWVGQRVPVTVEWWLSEAFAERLAGRRARVPLFDHVERFTFVDQEPVDSQGTLTVDTDSGTLELPMTVRRDTWNGEPYLVVSAARTLIALKAGKVVLEPSFIVVEEALQWSRDFFGNRVPSSVRRLRVQDDERTLVFQSPPAQGRPASFSGAVGEGFTIEVSADRSVMQTGDPIHLDIAVRGDAALDSVSLPNLALSGLDPSDFKIPSGPIAGIIDNGVKRFEVVLRATNDQVREIPPIALSWFNPDLGQYETTQSRPIAVSVGAANVVSADDVVRTEAPQEGDQGVDDQASDGRSSSANSPATGSGSTFSLSGAELAIETRSDKLMSNATPWYTRRLILGAMYSSGLLILLLAFVARRQTQVDPELRALRKMLEAERHSVMQATTAGDLTRALRRMAAAAPNVPRHDYDALLVDCDNLVYAPNGGDNAALDPTLRKRALAVARAMSGGKS